MTSGSRPTGPSSGVNGKQDITVRQLLSHQAGLAVIDEPLDLDILADLDAVAAIIAAQAPAWTPGERHGYHGITLGWYEGELLRRVDPAGRSLGRFFADEVAAPLGIEFYIGLPDDIDGDRLATIHAYKPAEMLLHLHEFPWRFVRGFLNPRSLTGKAFGNPRVLGLMDNYNRREVLRIESPASNGTGQVRAIARAYGALATGGHQLGLDAATLRALRQPATPPTGGMRDLVTHIDSAYSLGYVKPFPLFRFGSSANQAFGTPGGGGSFGFADPDVGIGFAYAMNRTGFRLFDDPREVPCATRCTGSSAVRRSAPTQPHVPRRPAAHRLGGERRRATSTTPPPRQGRAVVLPATPGSGAASSGEGRVHDGKAGRVRGCRLDVSGYRR
jgi:CubicO group peptidase (beta-lactamase class C family)